MYNKIKNPINNKFYNINSKIGKSVLNKYLNTNTTILVGGMRSNILIRYDPNDQNKYETLLKIFKKDKILNIIDTG